MSADRGLALGAFLKEEGLAHHFETLERHGTLGSLGSMLTANRVLFLGRLKEWGVSKLVERQKLANSLAKAVKMGRVGSAPPAPHLAPCSWTQTDGSIVIKLFVPSGTQSSGVAVTFDVNSLDVTVGGEPSSVCGRLHGIIKVAECFWELERAPPPDPAMFAEREDQREPDIVEITLAKARIGTDWPGLFAGGVGMSAKREKPPPPPEPPKPAPKPGSMNPGLGFVQRKLRFDRPDAAQDRGVRSGGGGGSRNGSTPAVAAHSRPARDHWDGDRAHFLWREGGTFLTGEAESPPAVEGHENDSGGGPLFWWRETAGSVVLWAKTRRGLDPSTIELDAREASIDLDIGGAPTPLCGSLCGRADPSGCRVDILPAAAAWPPSMLGPPAADAPWAVLQLTIRKAGGGAGSRYWRAPFSDLLSMVEARERLAGLPTRAELLDIGGWELAQSSRDFEVLVPLALAAVDGPDAADRIVRVAITTNSLNVHVAGRPEAPLLAGETFGRLVVGASAPARAGGCALGRGKSSCAPLGARPQSGTGCGETCPAVPSRQRAPACLRSYPTLAIKPKCSPGTARLSGAPARFAAAFTACAPTSRTLFNRPPQVSARGSLACPNPRTRRARICGASRSNLSRTRPPPVSEATGRSYFGWSSYEALDWLALRPEIAPQGTSWRRQCQKRVEEWSLAPILNTLLDLTSPRFAERKSTWSSTATTTRRLLSWLAQLLALVDNRLTFCMLPLLSLIIALDDCCRPAVALSRYSESLDSVSFLLILSFGLGFALEHDFGKVRVEMGTPRDLDFWIWIMAHTYHII
jgi:hypothetical protein